MSKYQRQIILPEIGESGQKKLADARILVVGAGGLGCALLPYLVGSGIGRIGIIDGDRVDSSNLHRQILYTPDSVGKYKVDEAKKFLLKQRPDIVIDTYSTYLTGLNARKIVEKYDVIVDATDRISSRYLINDTAVLCNKPIVYASIHRFEGQVSVFNYKNGPTYRCLFPKAAKVPNCAEAGVLGTSVGFIGLIQAQEVIKVILGIGDVLSGKLIMYNTLTASQQCFEFTKTERAEISQDFFEKSYMKQEVKTAGFNNNQSDAGTFIDVRELDELPRVNFNQLLKIPLSELNQKMNQLNKFETYYVFCQSGKRALSAAQQMYDAGFNYITAITDGAEVIANHNNQTIKN
ncbi:HesA/MoeB/ThiF family protein [Leeuwenhoekiella aequorea]|uniref:ThiF family adenylyltransferase n=1 Tax=Leeuwenhoekiella aequorea TaxID=283736 RepID=UPI00352BFC0E